MTGENEMSGEIERKMGMKEKKEKKEERRNGKRRKIRVLIVEDAAYMREMLEEMLDQQRDRYEIVGFAANGREAVEKYKELMPDIVTMDLVMEVMDGIQAIKEIKRYDKKAKILVITALGTPEYERESLEAGADACLWKPFTVKNLFEVLERLVSEEQGGG